MKPVKILVVVALGYVGLVAAFESLIGFFQPTQETTIVITTFDAEGAAHDRVVSGLDVGDRLYVAANHWPRAWYERALQNPEVRVTRNGGENTYRAVPVTGEEHAEVDAEHPLPPVFRFLTGFPPRLFLRLDPQAESGAPQPGKS
jgi:hypothetical protein